MSAKHTVWYSVGNSEFRHSCKTTWEVETPLCDIPGLIETDSTRNHDWIAEDCAENFNREHDGWESRWPLKFTLFASEDGPALGVFEIERDFEPVFSATAVKP